MTKISLDLDDALNRRLKQFALNKYGRTHGVQQAILKDALIAYLDAQESKPDEPEEAAKCEATTTEAEAVECTVEKGPVPEEVVIKSTPPKRKLSQDSAAIKKIEEMWNMTPRPPVKEIAAEAGYPYNTVAQHIKRRIMRGELEP
jgi:hypothetical protein